MIGWMAIAAAAVVGVGAPAATGCDPGGETVTCEDGATPVGDLGIEAWGCDCTARIGAGVEDRYWEFRSDLEVMGIREGGPAEGVLQRGDLITALDGRPLTEAATGRRFANLEPGETVTLTVRRGGETLELDVTAEGRCPPAAPTAPRAPRAPEAQGEQPTPPAAPAPLPMLPDLLPAGWLGIALECADCSVERADGEPLATWVFSEPPAVYRLDPDGPAARAGLVSGDVLQSIDGVAFTDPEGGRRFGAIQPGQTVDLVAERDGARREVRLTAAPPPPRAPRAPAAERWSGTVGDVDVEVRGGGSMVVDVRRNGREVEIVTPDGTVLLREKTGR